MAELDYQTALILQHTFDNEIKNNESQDYQIAAQLQEQFQREIEIESPSTSLTYSKKNKPNSNTKCLVDPSWEVIDPTPDIHVLFMAFNDRFFWSKLLAVCVSWSKRMTSCAGICSYHPRGGLCSITLSEPLLKLRPRKDLIETLLHEMIHAYLFVTHNNRDRDGHGPEFHKHMYRINNEAGTNITVYHNFHDEVRLYKQHWWRCDGPCQRWKPFFGMVRRATNRAPGPNDRWWAEHSRNCGGNFIKVREPEKIEKKQRIPKTNNDKENNKPLPDIRNYFNNTNVPTKGNRQTKSMNKVHRINTNNKSPKVSPITSTNSNIFGFTNLNSKGCSSTDKTSTNNDKAVVNPKKPISDNNNATKNIHTKPKPKFINKLPEPVKNQDYETVRNHWLNKFSTNTIPKSTPPPLDDYTRKPKIPKLEITDEIPIEQPNSAECPVCKMNMQLEKLNSHLDKCLEFQSDFQDCIVCNLKILKTEYERHVIECSDKNFSRNGSNDLDKSLVDLTDEPEKESPKRINCLACGKEINKVDLNTHLDDCLNDVFDEKNDLKEEEPGSSNKMCNCPLCMKLVDELNMSQHVDECLNVCILEDNM